MNRTTPCGPIDRLPLAVFLLFGLVAMAARSFPLTYELGLAPLPYGDPLYFMRASELPTCLRVGAQILRLAYQSLFLAIGQLMMVAPETQPLFLAPPADWPVKWLGAEYYFQHFVPAAALYATRLTLLVPIYLCVRRLYASPWLQAAHLVVVLVTLGGWPPVLVSAFFGLMRAVVDWPLAYYNFGHELLLADFAAIGFVHLLLLSLATPAGLRPLRIALLAALGQTLFENLGFVTGIAAAVAAILTEPGRDGRRLALRLFVAAGLASVPVMAGLVAVKVLVVGAAIPADSTGGYFADKWQMARQNFVWIKLVIAHLASLSVLPLLFGAALGVLARRHQAMPGESRRWLPAAAAVTIAAFTSLSVGSLVSGFFPDLGRQAAFLVTLLPTLAVTLMRDRR